MISLEQALRKMTVVPAQAMGLTDRGVLAEGMWADVVVFDPATIRDNATFEAPAAPDGIDVVLVNGTLTVDRRELAGSGDRAGSRDGFVADQAQAPGKVLRRRA